jgi:hypothetical protein
VQNSASAHQSIIRHIESCKNKSVSPQNAQWALRGDSAPELVRCDVLVCHREMLDQIIPLNESHLRRLGFEYLAYYHEDRTHL